MNKIILAADLGIPKERLTFNEEMQLKFLLTAVSKPFKNEPPTVVKAFEEKDNYFWIPRQFGLARYTPEEDRRSIGIPQNLEFKATLDPKRDQPRAVSEMVPYLERYGDGFLLAGTGTGKTLLSYAIASHFKTSIGVFLYAGHMFDNWIQQADLAFGLKPDDIGIVQKDRCDIGKPITLMSTQSFLHRTYSKEFYESIGFICLDEANHYGAEKWSTILRQFPAKYRLAITADKTRIDGLEKVVSWYLGDTGYEIIKKNNKLNIIGVMVSGNYPENSYKDWYKSEQNGRFYGDSLKYDKKLSKDSDRNKIIVDEIIKARRTGRRILVFSRLKDHLKCLHELTTESLSKVEPNYPSTKIDYLIGGMKDAQREEALKADIKFATYSYCRDALNDTSNDTLFFATPAGNPLQPAGRLRDKGPQDRRPLMILDFYETNEYSLRKWKNRNQTYESLEHNVKTIKRL